MVNTTTSSGPLTGPDAAAGLLAVSEANPRYFTVGSGNSADHRAVYLAGSHIWQQRLTVLESALHHHSMNARSRT